jgi:LmbE family N-acetylglucosaminyl deacetylase
MAKVKPSPAPVEKELPVVIAWWWAVRGLKRLWRRLAAWRQLNRWYAIVAFSILLGTTAWWAYQSAQIQLGNADQLVNAYLQQDTETFQQALLPSAHSFLIKWPLFWLVKALGPSAAVFTAVTVAVTSCTVLLFALLLRWIDKRAIVFGTLCLMLASVLLAVPAQPYPGGILPVNMAMLATRNLEYIIFLAGLVLLARSTHLKSKQFWGGIGILAVLAASDKLFATLAAGGAALALLAYAIRRKWEFVRLSAVWLASGIAVLAGAAVIIGLIRMSGLVMISDHTELSPYSITFDAKTLVLGTVYALIGLVTNFGANPSLNDAILRDVPAQVWHGLTSLGGLSYLVNGALLLAGLYAVGRLIIRSFAGKHANVSSKETTAQPAFRLALMLVWSSAASFVVFILSSHYYVVDARYLAITFFAVFTALAYAVSTGVWRRAPIAGLAALLCLSIASGFYAASRTNHADLAAMEDVNSRNNAVVRALKEHGTPWLVGDYWRVLPIKLHAQKDLQVMPLDACGQARQILSSKVWQPDLRKQRFAYLLSLDHSLTNYPSCTYSDITWQYGQPNSSLLVSGTYDKPRELLLFYDNGAHRSASAAQTLNTAKPSNPFLPVHIATVMPHYCEKETVMNIVAHEDDDLLFMNPDIWNDVKTGNCVRTLYLTAGDAGNGDSYWRDRERGAKAAYNVMLGLGNETLWTERVLKLADDQFVTIAQPQQAPHVSLVFMHLPDGGVGGSGFDRSRHESLHRLETGDISTIHSVDRQSSYSAGELTQAISKLIAFYQPAAIRTQSVHTGALFPDHSDHGVVGRIVQSSYAAYQGQYPGRPAVPISYYLGYRSHALAQNVDGDQLSAKREAFRAYAAFDVSIFDGLCSPSDAGCAMSETYQAYLERQYHSAED